jgi:hypothetical protein
MRRSTLKRYTGAQHDEKDLKLMEAVSKLFSSLLKWTSESTLTDGLHFYSIRFIF